MPYRCVAHCCSNRSDVKAGISAHLSRAVKSQRDKWLTFVRTHRANFNPSGNFFPVSLVYRCEIAQISFHDFPRPTLKFHDYNSRTSHICHYPWKP